MPTHSPAALREHFSREHTQHNALSDTERQRLIWRICAVMEDSWLDAPHKERVRNRHSVLLYLTGIPSTKALADSALLRLGEWCETFDVFSECRACLTAALVEAGQAELPLGESL